MPQFEDCEYGTSSYFCNQHFTCWGTWAKSNIPPFFCKADDACGAAIDGVTCHAPGQVCPSGDAGVCVCSECGVGPPPDVEVAHWKCFSPIAGCAVDRPNAGTACDLRDAGDAGVCRYAGGGCCTGVYESCTDGVWIGEETEPCP